MFDSTMYDTNQHDCAECGYDCDCGVYLYDALQLDGTAPECLGCSDCLDGLTTEVVRARATMSLYDRLAF